MKRITALLVVVDLILGTIMIHHGFETHGLFWMRFGLILFWGGSISTGICLKGGVEA